MKGSTHTSAIVYSDQIPTRLQRSEVHSHPQFRCSCEILTFDLGAVAYREPFSSETMCVQVSAVWLDSTALKKHRQTSDVSQSFVSDRKSFRAIY